jgi:hypothetical protein
LDTIMNCMLYTGMGFFKKAGHVAWMDQHWSAKRILNAKAEEKEGLNLDGKWTMM